MLEFSKKLLELVTANTLELNKAAIQSVAAEKEIKMGNVSLKPRSHPKEVYHASDSLHSFSTYTKAKAYNVYHKGQHIGHIYTDNWRPSKYYSGNVKGPVHWKGKLKKPFYTGNYHAMGSKPGVVVKRLLAEHKRHEAARKRK